MNKQKKKLICLASIAPPPPPPSQNVDYFFDEMGKIIDHYSNCCENFITVVDFNIEEKQEIKC